jgi:signal peptidase II
MLRFGLALAVAVFVADQVAKYLILEQLHLSPPGCLISGRGQGPECRDLFVAPFFRLTMVWNKGVSFGMLRADSGLGRWGLVVLSFAISGLFGQWLRTATRRLTAVSLGLVIGGALGNVVDRIRFGAVVDFLNFGPIFPWVFNVADASITVGAALLLIDFLKHGEAKPAPASAQPPQSLP